MNNQSLKQYSIWEEDSFNSKQDIFIIGAGFTGLWTSLFLKQKYPDKKILIAEKDIYPAGASLKNAGFSCFGSLTEILSDIRAMGETKAIELLRKRYEGLKIIQKIFPPEKIEYVPCNGYELLNNSFEEGGLQYVNALLEQITGVDNTFVLRNDLINTFGFINIEQLIENRFEGALHPGKLLQALIQSAISMGIQIQFATDIKSVEESGQQIKVYTTDERCFGCEQLIYCTNAYSKRLLPAIDITPARGQVLLTEPVNNLKIKGCFHFDEGFYYFRNLGNRILLGGARNTSFQTEFTLESNTTLTIQENLEKFLTHIILPHETVKISHRWAGIMAFGNEKYPIVQQLTDRTFCAVRLSGMGVALAPMIGKELAFMF